MEKALGNAFRQFYELGKSGKWCCLNISFDYNYVLDITLVEAERNKKNPKHGPTIHVSTCELDSIADIIVLLDKAIVAAKEYEEKNKCGSTKKN